MDGQVAVNLMALNSSTSTSTFTSSTSSNGNQSFADSLLNGSGGSQPSQVGIAFKAFLLNIAVSLGLFTFEVAGFFLLKSSAIGRRI